MADIKGRYPFSTSTGQAIPVDIIRPEGVVLIPFTAASGSTAFSLATGDCFFFKSSADCLVKFAASSASASIPSNNTLEADMLYIPRETLIIVSPPIDKRSLSVIGLSSPGRLIIQYLQTWSGLTLKDQQVRR